MPRYCTRSGVVLTSICEEYVLVAAFSLRKQVPAYAKLNESSAFLWRLLENGADEEDLLQAVMKEYTIEAPDEARSVIDAFIGQMVQIGYLLKEGEQDEE